MDTIYCLEADTIWAANRLLDSYLRKELALTFKEELRDQNAKQIYNDMIRTMITDLLRGEDPSGEDNGEVISDDEEMAINPFNAPKESFGVNSFVNLKSTYLSRAPALQ